MRKGFTVIELLVIVAIMVILGALLYDGITDKSPRFGRGDEVVTPDGLRGIIIDQDTGRRYDVRFLVKAPNGESSYQTAKFFKGELRRPAESTQ